MAQMDSGSPTAQGSWVLIPLVDKKTAKFFFLQITATLTSHIKVDMPM